MNLSHAVKSLMPFKLLLLLLLLAIALCSSCLSLATSKDDGAHSSHFNQARLSRAPADTAPAGASKTRRAHFGEPQEANSTQRVAVGRSVRFKCVVNDIGDHKLAWFHKDRRILLALDNKTVAWRDRIQVSTQANSVFVLQIDSVQLTDKVSSRWAGAPLRAPMGSLSLPAHNVPGSADWCAARASARPGLDDNCFWTRLNLPAVGSRRPAARRHSRTMARPPKLRPKWASYTSNLLPLTSAA